MARGTAANISAAMSQPPLCLCRKCRRPMTLIRTLPRLGGVPELQVFYCRDCDEVEGKDVEDLDVEDLDVEGADVEGKDIAEPAV